MEEDQILNYVYFDRYKPEKKIGQGSFGRIYQGINISGNEKVAMKFEEKEKNLLETETYRMIYLKGEGVPKVYCFGNDNKYNILVMELLGRSMDSYFTECGKKFKFLTVCHLGIEMVKRIKYIHQKNHIHRDIKPENFVMGIDENLDNLYIIDFGLAKKYRSSKTFKHIDYKVHKKLTGTIRYSSINASNCVEQSRRDDLESIGYLICYFLRGNLPWQGLKIAPHEDRYRMIYKKKRDTRPEELCPGFHKNIARFIEYCRGLEFEKEPDYNYLIGLLCEAMDNQVLKVDFDFDWNKDRGSFQTNQSRNNELDTSNLSNIKNKNSNSGYSSLINKNDISHDLKNIMIEETNSIKKYKEQENSKKDHYSPQKQVYKTNGTLGKDEENEKSKPRSNSQSTKKGPELFQRKEGERRPDPVKQEKVVVRKEEKQNQTPAKEEGGCLVI